MASQVFPLTLHSVCELTTMGIDPASFRFGQLYLESDRFICVKDSSKGELFIVDLNDNSLLRKPTQADAALMHRTESIIALRAKTEGTPGQMVQVVSLETKERLGNCHINETIALWKWIGPRLLALVTEKAVFHWNLQLKDGATEPEKPEKIFEREGRLAEGVQVINYAVDNEIKWCLLTAISTQDGGKTIDGSMQLYAVELKRQQQIEGHGGCFGELVLNETKGPQPVICFTEKKRGSTDLKLHVRDIYSPRDAANPPFKLSCDIQMPAESSNDFPLSVHLSKSHGVVYILTKGGLLFLFDAQSGTAIFRHRVSNDPVFISCDNNRNSGILLVNKKGSTLTATVNEQTVIAFIQNNLTHIPNRQQIAMSLAKRYGFPGADNVLIQDFNRLFSQGDYKAASRVAATMKSGALRTAQTIQLFKNANVPAGESSAILQYFSTLLDYGKLNALESVELARPVVAQGRKDFIEKWLGEGQLECTEELGDIVKPLDVNSALTIYLNAKASTSAIQCLVEMGKFDQIVSMTKKFDCPLDHLAILRNVAAVNAEAATAFSKQIVMNKPPLADPNAVMDVMFQTNRLQEITSVMLEFLKPNLPEHGRLQTRLLEVNLIQLPKVAETIFQMELLSQYDRPKIAALCEKAALYQRALEHFTDINDIKRVMMQTGGQLSQEWMLQFFCKMQPDVCLEILTDMLRSSSQNLRTVVAVAIRFHEQIGADELIGMFEKFGSFEGIFYFLGAIFSASQSPNVHFKYIEAAAKLNHLQEVERVCRESKVYDPKQVKDFLKEAKLSDPRSLIYVCDLHNFVPELAEYLFRNSLLKYIEVYVSRVNPQNAPQVIGVLIDLDAPEDFVLSLLQAVRGMCAVEPLVEEVERRNRLKLLLPWLEARVAEGNQEPALHNALAKICIETNREPEQFLQTNKFYDSKVVGKFCEDRDPHLAFTAYKRAWGSCDTELVEVTGKNGLFRLQARYLVERQSPELWAFVLNEDNEHRRSVIDQVVSTALPDSTSAEEVSVAVNAFINAQLPHELIELLEKIVLHNSDFASNKNLQNLLILTAIKADKKKVLDYVNRLDNYDGPSIAQVAVEYNLQEEAFAIYKKFKMNISAADTLLSDAANLDRAVEFAQRCNEPEVWSRLGVSQLRKGNVAEAIDSLLKANDASHHSDVIDAAQKAESWEPLVRFLQMARRESKVKDQRIDSELLFALARADHLDEMEAFVNRTNTANVQQVGDRLFEAKHFQAARILYASIPNNAKLSSTLLRLGEYAAAVDAARKANSPKTWKEVAFACIDVRELKCAQTASLNIIIHPDHLDDLILHYETQGLFEELIALLEEGLSGERTHVGLFTELGILYAKHRPERLMDFIKQHSAKMNIPKSVRACERLCLWKEAVVLHIAYDEFDHAASKMILHCTTAWSHDQFVRVMQQVSSTELLYKAVTFYLEHHPLELCTLLSAIEKKIDHARVVQLVRKAGHLPLITKYLQQIQNQNVTAVNEALIEVYIESEDVEALRQAVSDFDNFDQLAVAQQLEQHELLEMRRLSGLLYKKNKKFRQAIELAKRDRHYRDAMETARDSKCQQLAEELLRFFTLELKDKDCFAACLYVCYELLRPDVALELAWRNGCIDQCMPFLIQVLREYTHRVDVLDRKVETREQSEEKQRSAPNDFVADYIGGAPPAPHHLSGMGNLALMPPPGAMAAGGGGAPPNSFGVGLGLSGGLMGGGGTPHFPAAGRSL